MKRIYIIVLAIIVVLALIGLLPLFFPSNELFKRDNLAGLNGSFETTDSGYPVNWAFGPNPESDDFYQVSVDITKSQEGDQSLKLTSNQSERTVAIRSVRVPIQPEKTYRIAFSVQNTGCTLKVNRIVQDASGTTHMRSKFIVNTSAPISNWTTFEETLVAADGEASVVLIFLVDGPGSIWVDDVKVEEIP